MLRNTKFRRIHVTVIDLIDDDDTLITEQAFLDEHDDLVASYSAIMTLADSANPSSTKTISESEILSRRCDLLESRLKDMDTALSSLTPDD